MPIGTQFECSGSRTASNRSLQWGTRSSPLESKNDYEAMYLLSKRLGIEEQMFKHIQVDGDAPMLAEDILREINRGTWSIGYTGQSPERLKQHMEQQGDFDMVSLRGKLRHDGRGRVLRPALAVLGTPELKHPGTHVLYNTHEHVMKGGGTFRARSGVERDGETLLAEGAGRSARDRGRLSRKVRPTASSRRSVGRRPDRRRSWRASRRSAARMRTASPGPSISRAASSGSRWRTAACPTATP
ncbi:MAG: hypothetical protein R3D28_09620 [Geminicoccaceae bacterium]